MGTEDVHSLRELNLKLKTVKDTQINKKKPRIDSRLKNSVWEKNRHMEYTTNVYSLNKNKDKLPRNTCPQCEGNFQSKDLVEHNMSAYVYRCPHCGSIMHVLKL